ncbi:hypothetical protein [Bdellovibrio sp.]|uniref:hypothetical protein n=1 Tax=Bdellovibrio sp. TaxID=28201 RepID=UPI003221E6E2
MTLKQAHKTVFALTVLLSLTSMGVQASAQQQKSREAMKEAFRACSEELGIERPKPGQRPQAPDEETRDKMDACLKEKGFEPPVKFGHGPGGRDEQGRPTEGVR